MITRPTTIEELKDMFSEMFLANTSLITKITAGSAMNATAYGVAKLSQKILKDVGILESQLFPDSAYGTYLDDLSLREGVPARFGALEGTTYIRLVAPAGTFYDKTIVQFTGKHGVIYELDDDVTVSALGFDYGKVRATTTGETTNVEPLSINRIINPPVGHQYVINEYRAQNGQDTENDELFRKRIKEGANILSTGTLAKYEQVFIKLNPRVLNIYFGGINLSGQYIIYMSSVNGVDFSAGEFLTMLTNANDFFSMTEQVAGIELRNINWYPVDISMRLELDGTVAADDVRIAMQIAMQKYLDWRFWEFGQKVEWDDLLEISKQTLGVRRVLDNYFVPHVDLLPATFELPRVRSFTIYDTAGAILSNVAGTLNPAYFPNQPQFVLQQTLFSQI